MRLETPYPLKRPEPKRKPFVKRTYPKGTTIHMPNRRLLERKYRIRSANGLWDHCLSMALHLKLLADWVDTVYHYCLSRMGDGEEVYAYDIQRCYILLALRRPNAKQRKVRAPV